MKLLRLLVTLPALVALLVLSHGSTPPSSAQPYVYEVYMYGSNVVPPVNTQAYGFLRFFFNESMTEADVTVDVKGLSNSAVTGADIRAGKPGANGPVVIHLSDGDFIVTSTRIKLTPADLQHMVNGDWYGVVYSPYHPEGEMRGQITLPASAIGAPPTPTAAPPPATAPAAPPPRQGSPAAGGAVISPPNTGDAGLR